MESAPPRWSTPRSPSRATYGPAVAEVAKRLGHPFMPWQSHVENVAGEVLDDGRMAYPVVVLIVPRRAGKTLGTLARSIQRAVAIPGGRCWYTAQTGGDAGLTFREEWVPIVKASPLASALTTRLSNGSESLTLPKCRSRIGIFAPTEKALHGQAADHVVVDEAWAFSDLKGTMLEAAIRPTMATRRQRQLWIISAGGTDESTWLLRFRELGRAMGIKPDEGLAYFEWHPEVDAEGEVCVDLDDPAVWAATHPAVGHTIDLDALRADWISMPRDVFYRSYLNVFQSASGLRLIPEAPWRDCRDPEAGIDPEATLDPISCGYDVALDYSASAIAYAVPTDDGRHMVEVVEYLTGTEGLAERLVELHGRYHLRLAANGAGPVRSTTRELREIHGLDVHELTEREVVDASGEWLRDVLLGSLVHRGQPPLDAAVAGAGKRELGDGWAFTRKASTAEISPLMAGAVALHQSRRPVGTAPLIILG